jgi:hypothetical protein
LSVQNSSIQQVVSGKATRRDSIYISSTLLSQAARGEAAEQRRKLFELFAPGSPEPVRFPRKQIDLNFAVLLLRSGYTNGERVHGTQFRTRQG